MPEVIGYNRNKKLSRRMSKETESRLDSAQERLRMGQAFRQKQREAVWEDNYSLYMGDEWDVNVDDPTADVVNVNIAFSTINTLVPFVADEDPTFLVSPYSGDATAENAVLLQSFMNRLWKSSDVRGQNAMSDATHDYLLYGDGVVKVGYEVRMKEIYDELGESVENNVDIAHFMVERVNPWDFWLDPYSDGLHNARWCAQRIIMPKHELLNDDRYKAKNEDDVPDTGMDDRHLAPEDRSRLDDVDTSDWVTIFEFYDLKEDWMMTFTMGTQTPLRYIEHIKAPYVQLQNYRIPNSPYHMSELEQISSLQHELNKTRSQMITHRRRNVAKWAIRKHLISDEAEQAMKSSRVNAVIPIEANEPLENLISMIAPQPMSQDAYAMDAQIRADINEISGVNEYLRGVPQNISRTATEATIIEGATNIRTRHKLLQIERAARDTGQLLLDIIRDVLPLTDFEEMRQFITGREAERLNRRTGQEEINTDLIFTPTPEIFVGRYEVEVERGSTELRNPQVRAQKFKEMVMLMLNATPILQQMQIPFNIKKLLEMWFEAEGIDDVDALFEPDEAQVQMMQLAMAERANAAAAAGQPGQGGGPATPGGFGGAGQTQPGQPRAQTARPPSDLPDESNSGMLPPI